MSTVPLVEFAFRLADVGDAGAIRAILNQAYTDSWTKRGLLVRAATQNENETRLQIADRSVYVLLHKGQIAGTVRVQRKELRNEVVAYVTHLARRQGSAELNIGQRLMTEAEGIARSFGASLVTLDTAQEIDGLIAFYRALGYESTGRFVHTSTAFWSLWFEKKV